MWSEADVIARNAEVFGAKPEPKRKRRAATSEAEIQRTCTQILMHDGWRALRTDPVSDRKRGKGFGEVGMPDYLYIRYTPFHRMSPDGHYMSAGHILWIEWKKEGGTPEPHQLAWHADERSKGALTWIAGVDFPATVDGFVEFYAKSGLKR